MLSLLTVAVTALAASTADPVDAKWSDKAAARTTLTSTNWETNAAGGRWVHIHTKIGSTKSPGDYQLADAALSWLIK